MAASVAGSLLIMFGVDISNDWLVCSYKKVRVIKFEAGNLENGLLAMKPGFSKLQALL